MKQQKNKMTTKKIAASLGCFEAEFSGNDF
jgi:hypothetical protein